MNIDAIKEAVKSQLQDPRDVQDSAKCASELSRLARSRMCDFPIADTAAYFEAIQALVVDGYLELVHGNQVRRKPVIEAAPVEVPKHVQGSLFDF